MFLPSNDYIDAVIYRFVWILWKNRLSRSFRALLNSENPKYELYFIGFGDLRLTKETHLISGNNTHSLDWKFKPLIANTYHARSELIREKLDNEYQGVNLKTARVIRRAISIGIYSRSFINGIHNGFSVSVICKKSEIASTPLLSNSSARVRLSRMSASIGCVIPKLETDLEVEIRRNDRSWDIQFLESFLTPYSNNFILRAIYRKCFPFFINDARKISELATAQMICKGLPEWHYARSFFTLQFNKDIFQAVNIYKKAFLQKANGVFRFYPESIEGRIQWCSNLGVADSINATYSVADVQIIDSRHVILSDYLLPDDTTLMDQIEGIGGWPHSLWSTSKSDFVAVPNSLENIDLPENTLLLPCSSNWAHFMEEVLPRLVLAEKDFSYNEIVTSDVYDSAQSGAIATISKAEISTKMRTYRYSTPRVFCTVHENRRLLAIRRELNGKDLVNQDSMRIIRDSALRAVTDIVDEDSPSLIYIQRKRTALRKILNRKKIEGLLKSKNFFFIRTEELSYTHRVKLFQNAKIVVCESGAGGANIHFCNNGTQVIELRHPGMILSEEEVALTATGRFEWIKIEGKKARIFSRLFKGTDSYSIKINVLENELQNCISRI